MVPSVCNWQMSWNNNVLVNFGTISKTKISLIIKTSGLYYKPITIIIDDSRVVNKHETSLIEDARVITYDHHMFIVQAIGGYFLLILQR
jgi:hypothetical protein